MLDSKVNGDATGPTDVTRNACCLDVEPWDLTIIELENGEDNANLPELVDCLWTPEANGNANSRAQPLLLLRQKGKDCIVMPRSPLTERFCKTEESPNAEKRLSWTALTLPTAQPLGTLHGLLADAGFETLLFASPSAGKPCALVRASDVSPVACLLVKSGFAVGPAKQLCRAPAASLENDVTADSSRAGLWVSGADADTGLPFSLRRQGKDLPYHSRFETDSGLFIDIRIPTRAGGPLHSIEASCSGYCVPHADGVARHHTLSMQPPKPGPTEDEDNSLEWTQSAKGCTTVLELLSAGPYSGLWIFSGGFFARITGLPRGEGLVGGYCCNDVSRLSQLVGTAVDAELRGQYDAVLGCVERPGVLSMLRRSWVEAADGSVSSSFYNSELGEGGLIEVDRENGLVVHHLLGGGEQRWRILSMDEDPFTPPGGSRLLIDADKLPVFKAKKASAPEEAGSSDGHSEDEKENKKSNQRDNDKKDRRRRGSSSSASPSIVLFEEKGKRSHKDKEKEKGKNRDKDKERDKKEKGKDRGRGKDKDRSRSGSSSADRKKKGKRKDDDKSSSSGEGKKDKKRSSKEDKRKKSRSKSRSKSRKKRGKSRSKRRKDKSRSRSKKKKDKSRSRSRSKRSRDKERAKKKDSDKGKRKDASDSGSDKPRSSLRKRVGGGGGFDLRQTQSVAIVPLAQQLPGQPQPTSVPGAVPMMSPYQLSQLAEANPEVEAFLAMNPVEGHAGMRLRTLPAHIARLVIHRGSLLGARDPAAVLNSRIRDAMQGGQVSLPMMPSIPPPPGGHSSHSGIEVLISRYNIDAQCGQMLRALPPHLQAQASELPMHEARNPSAFMMAQLQLPRFRQGMAAPGGPAMFAVV